MRQAIESSDTDPMRSHRRDRSDKRVRVIRAARRLFVENGYDETTARMIAKEADVALGTVFTYATDKRDLLFLIINEGLDAAWRCAEVSARAERIFLVRLQKLFRELYMFFGAEPALARYVLREMYFHKESEQATQFETVSERARDLIGRFVDQAKMAGEVRNETDTELAATLIFSIYQAEIRRWLIVDDGDVDLGLQQLGIALSALMEGLAFARPSPMSEGQEEQAH